MISFHGHVYVLIQVSGRLCIWFGVRARARARQNQDELGVQAKRVRSHDLLPITKSGICRSEELPQNTIIAPCDANDPLQRWSLHANGTIGMGATGECLTADSGQGGDCGGANGTTCTKEGAGSWWKICAKKHLF